MTRTRIPVYALMAFATLFVLLLCVSLFATFSATFSDYSARFGSLSESEFAALNARMDNLRLLSKLTVFALLFPLDVATVVLGIRAWTKTHRAPPLVVAIVAGIFALAAALLVAVASAMPSGGMIG